MQEGDLGRSSSCNRRQMENYIRRFLSTEWVKVWKVDSSLIKIMAQSKKIDSESLVPGRTGSEGRKARL